MAEDLKYIKMVIRSLLTSSPGTITISQVLSDYMNLEGEEIPYKKLGYKTVYELLAAMNDILKLPKYPNINSHVKLIVDEKTSHLRDLVVNQKTRKKPRRNKCFYNKSSSNSQQTYSKNINKTNFHEYQYNNNSRGYTSNCIKQKPHFSFKGKVTKKLQTYVEDLCNSENVSVNFLKCCILSHPDYKQMKTSNVDDAINMLKHFIYISKGIVYLKENSFEIFKPERSKNQNRLKQNLKNVVDENEELSYSAESFDLKNTEKEETLDLCSSNGDINNTKLKSNCSTFLATEKNNTVFTPHPNSIIKHEHHHSVNNIQVAQKNDNKLKISSLPPKKLYHNLPHKMEILEPKGEQIDYKQAIVSIISNSKTTLTVKKVITKFQQIYGYSFPHKKLSCVKYMDFFRLYPSLFKLENPYSTDSIVTLKENKLFKPKSSIRKHFVNASIFKDDSNTHSEIVDSVTTQILLLSLNNNNENDVEEIKEHTDNIPSLKTNIYYEKYDCNMVPHRIKERFRFLLKKNKNAIPNYQFLDIYAFEYNEELNFVEYGFKGVIDMAYKLPSIFYVKINEKDSEYYFYEAEKRNEFENNENDPLLFYKNIPKTILHNLSLLFDMFHYGINFEDIKKLYCKKFGQSYEPLNYGYSSEKHMFESLNKMVTIKDNIIYSLDPFAYTNSFKDKEYWVECPAELPIFRDKNFLLNYSGTDVYNGKFDYPPFEWKNQDVMDVAIAEIFTANSFYIQIYSELNNLENFMRDLQDFYNANENTYTVLPDLIIPGLVCTSRFENSKLWHRAKVINIFDEDYVEVFYVDFGSSEVILKSAIRLLATNFGHLPVQSFHCSLYEDDEIPTISFPEVNLGFADLVDGKLLCCHVKQYKSKIQPEKKIISLYLKIDNEQIDIKLECSKLYNNYVNKDESIRRNLFKEANIEEINPSQT